MNLKNFLQRWLPMRWQKVGSGDPVSMVLLLRTPHSFRKEDLESAAERAWRISFTGESPMHCVVQKGRVTLMKAGPHALNLIHSNQPYLDREGTAAGFEEENYQRAWREHTAWLAVDYLNSRSDIELAYCVLAKFVSELLNENCAGVFIPRENKFSLNGKSLYNELQTMASTRELGIVLGR